MPPYVQLPVSQRGLWAQTATIDWCESNYELSYYIAEFWNTLSNLAFIAPQLHQYMMLSKQKSVEMAYRSAFLSLALVGFGSFCFHMTLARPMQMFDETSMILVSLHGFYLLYIIRKPNVNKYALGILLLLYGLIFLSLYVVLVHRPIFHHTTFGLLVYASAAIGYQLKKRHGPHYKFWTVLIMQHLAFAFWLIDKHYCELLTNFRDHHIPYYLKPVFQFHALWHLLMGLGSHTFICGLIRLRAWTKHSEEFRIRFKYLGLWIVLEKLDPHESPLAASSVRESLRREAEALGQQENNKSLKSRKLVKVNNTIDDVLDLNQNQVH